MTAPIHSTSILPVFFRKSPFYFKWLLVFFFFFPAEISLQAQSTTEEWIARAEEAAAAGQPAESGSAYSSAAHKQMESGDFEAAAENFKKAAEQFKKDGRAAQAGTETTNAASAFEAAAEEAARNGDHAKAAELYDKAAEQYEADEREAMAESARRKADHERTYPASIVITATGNTAGAIAEISITNHLNQPQNITIPNGTIPSDGNYQGFIIPQKTDMVIPPHATHSGMLVGFCMDPKLPPPPPGTILPPTNTWNPSVAKVVQVNDIIRVTNRLIANGKITTPFGKGQDAADLVTQFIVWRALSDKPLTPAELCEEVIKEFAALSSTPVHDLSPDAKNALDFGVLQVKDAVDKVINEVGIPALTPTLPPAASILKDAPPSSHPAITSSIKPTGTGNTTGHVADLTMSNPTKNPVTVSFGNGSVYIPGEGGQPLAVPSIAPVPLAPGETKTIPVNGFCTDIRVPPVPKGESMPPVSKWINLEPPGPSGQPPGIVSVPMQKALPIPDAVALLMNIPNATTPVSSAPCPEETITPQPLLSGTNSILQIPVDPHDHPAVGVPLVLDALNHIIGSYDELKSGGKINTPFGNNLAKERESVIQQTFWLFTSALRDKPYDKSEFVAMTNRQLEQNTGKKAEELPAPEQEKYAQGIDDFWGTFTLVGTESKLLTTAPVQPAPQPGTSEVFDSFKPESLKSGESGAAPEGTTTSPRQTVSDPTEPPSLIKDESKGACKCGEISIEFDVIEMVEKEKGKYESVGRPDSKSAKAEGAKTKAVHEVKCGKKNLKNGQMIAVKLKKVDATCPCSDKSECQIFRDAAESNAYDAAVIALAKAEKDAQDKLAKAEADLAKAIAALEGPKVKAKYEEAIAALDKAIKDLDDANDLNDEFKEAEDEYKKALEKSANAKGKQEKIDAAAEVKAAKSKMDEAKKKKPTDATLRSLEAKVKSAQAKVDDLEKAKREAQQKLDAIKKTIADAQAKVAANSSGQPVIRDKDGGTEKDINWGNNTVDFRAVKQGNAKIEFTFYVGFYCKSDACSPVECGRTFVIKIEE